MERIQKDAKILGILLLKELQSVGGVISYLVGRIWDRHARRLSQVIYAS